jgi:hypothetical protein
MSRNMGTNSNINKFRDFGHSKSFSAYGVPQHQVESFAKAV